MGHRHKNAANRGSLGFRPRSRAKRESARWRSSPTYADSKPEPQLIGFAGYKVGMTHVVRVEEKLRDPHFKQEKMTAVTVIELPQTIVFALRLMKYGDIGDKQVLGEIWYHKVEKDFHRILKPPKEITDDEFSKKIAALKEQIKNACEIRLLLYTLPRQAGFSRKRPDIIETKIAGSNLEANFDFGADLLGKTINFADHFKPGEFIDITAVTKGKGFSGPVKRHGIKLMPRKKRKGMRVVGAIGAWHPARTGWTVPRPGQLGYHQRTESNKKILKISDNPREINPKGGWKHYGLINSPYAMLEGSIPGTSKRLIRMRRSMRLPPEKYSQTEEIKVSFISTTFGQRSSATQEDSS